MSGYTGNWTNFNFLRTVGLRNRSSPYYLKVKDTKELKFDVIGDIHGCATELEELLISLGYLEIGRCFRRSDGRRVVFLGDYIDRGLEVRRTLEIVRSMVDNGQAYAILGNHELNALRFHQRGPDGEWMRPHTPSKVSQHQSTLDQIVHPDPISWRKWMDWFAELPLWLEFPEFRGSYWRLNGFRAAWN